MATTNTDAANLIAAVQGGLINEDVMQTISDITDFPLVLTDMIGSGSHKNPYREWTQDALEAPDLANAVIDGSDQDNDDSVLGLRVGNHSQTSVKQVKVSHRASNSDTIGRAKEVVYQISRRSRALSRDIDAIMSAEQESIADDGATVAGLSASIASWLTTNTSRGITTGADGGFGATSPTIVDAPVAGDKRGLTETLVRDAAQSAYVAGGNPDMLMAVPGVIRKFSEFCFDATARVGIQQTQTGKVETASKAVGSVNVFVSDFGSVLKFAPNRLQPVYTDVDVSTVFLLDPAGLSKSNLSGKKSEQLAKTGLSESWLISEDWTLVVRNEAEHALIADIDSTVDVIA